MVVTFPLSIQRCLNAPLARIIFVRMSLTQILSCGHLSPDLSEDNLPHLLNLIKKKKKNFFFFYSEFHTMA